MFPRFLLCADIRHVQDLPALHTAQNVRDLTHLEMRKYVREYGLSPHFEDNRQAIATAIGCSEYQ